LRIVVQELVEDFVVIVNEAIFRILEPSGNRLEQAQSIDRVVDGGVFRHTLDDVDHLAFRAQVA
jgi:hypothetical protein